MRSSDSPHKEFGVNNESAVCREKFSKKIFKRTGVYNILNHSKFNTQNIFPECARPSLEPNREFQTNSGIYHKALKRLPCLFNKGGYCAKLCDISKSFGGLLKKY